MDTARQLLDSLMGRNRNLDPIAARERKVTWKDPEFCIFHMVKFCPHELFVNTRADLGPCPKVHDEEARRLYYGAHPGHMKRSYEFEFLRFANHLLCEVDRKIVKGKQRLELMSTSDEPSGHVSKHQEQLNNMNARIRKLIGEAEEAGKRGDVEQAQGLMTLCDQLKDDKEELKKHHDLVDGECEPAKGDSADSKWNIFGPTEKQMEVCVVCGAFLIVGDAQQRLEDHLTGKQHQGYFRLRQAVEELQMKRAKIRVDMEDSRRDGFRLCRRRDEDEEVDSRRGGYGEPSAGYGESSAGYGEPSAGYGASSAGYVQSSAAYVQSSAGYGEPSGSSGSSSSSGHRHDPREHRYGSSHGEQRDHDYRYDQHRPRRGENEYPRASSYRPHDERPERRHRSRSRSRY